MATETVEIVIKERGAAATSSSLKQVGQSASASAPAVSRLAAAIAALAAAFSARTLVNASDQFTRLSRAVQQSTKDTGDTSAVMNELLAISNRTTTSIADNAQLFQRFSVATKNVGASNKDVLDVVEGLNAALILSGANASEASAGLIQLGQGLASGRLAGDELKSVLENLPQLGQALSKELGVELGDNVAVTVGRLRELGAEGRLTAEVVFPALQRAVQGFKGELATTPRTVGETIQVLQNEFLVTVGELNNALGGTGGLNTAILGLAGNLRTILFSAFQGFVSLAIEVLTTVEALRGGLDSLGIEVLPSVGQAFKSAGLSILLFIQAVTNGINTILLGIQSVNTAGTRIAAVINPFFSADTVKAEEQKLVDAQNAVIASSARIAETTKNLGTIFTDVAKNGIAVQTTAVTDLTAKLEALRANLIKVGDAAPTVTAAAAGAGVSTASRGEVVPVGPTKEQLKAQTDAAKELLSIQQALDREKAASVSSRQAEIFDVQVLIAKAKELAAIAGLDAGSNPTLAALELKLKELQSQTDVGAQLGANVSTALSDGFQQSLASGQDLATSLGSAFEQSANASLSAGLAEATQGFQDGLTSVFSGAANSITSLLTPAFGEAAAGLGAGLTSVLGFVAQQGLSALFGGGGNSSSSSGGKVQSAVTSTQAVRGIVAGPSQIAIAEVGDSISDSIGPAVILLQAIDQKIARALELLGRPGSGSSTSSDARTLATQSAPLASS